MISRGARGSRGETGRLCFLRVKRHGRGTITIRSHGRQGARDILWWAQISARVLDARSGGKQGSLGIGLVLARAGRESQGFGGVEGVVEDECAGEGHDGVNAHGSRHCASDGTCMEGLPS